MTISETLKANILRYYHVEKWRVNTIVRQLGVHHTTVKRVLSETGVPKHNILVGKSMIDPYLGFIHETLERFPTLTASRLYDMVVERGYPGGLDHFRHLISVYRPKKAAEAYLRLKTLPGEQAQVDWAHFGHIVIGKAKRPIMAFVMILSFSRKIFLHFYLNQRTENFLRGHQEAFVSFGGVPKVLLYDNLKSAVLERMGDAIRFNPMLLDFAAHYHFEPRPVAVYRGNEKGRVERSIRFIRDNFFAGREFKSLDDLNSQAAHWCNTRAIDRPCPEDNTKTVREIFESEKPSLLQLPETTYPCDEVEQVRVGKTPYARFDLNDYSVPHTFVRTTLTLKATLQTITILDGANVIATHARCFDKGSQIECESHIKDLAEQKSNARVHRGQNRLTHAIDCGSEFLSAAAKAGYSLSAITKQLLEMLNDYGSVLLSDAMEDALSRSVPHHNAVRLSIQRQLDEKSMPPPVNPIISEDKRVNEQVVKTHDLNKYEILSKCTIDEEQ